MAANIHAEAGSGRPADVRAVFDDLVRVETRLYNLANERLRACCGITGSQFEFLDLLARHPGARVADLADAFAIGVGAVSKGVDRLVAAGWVRREANPADGRSSLLRLTGEGAAVVRRAGTEFDRLLAEHVVDVVDPADLAALGGVLRLLRTGLESRRAGLPLG